MGEIAEMMLDGTMCQGCGEWLHDGEDGEGFPDYCSSCRASGYGTPSENPVSSGDIEAIASQIGKKLRNAIKWPAVLEMGMYPGCRWEDAPTQFARLEKMGLVESYHPHNAIHKTRCVHTAKGKAVYELLKKQRKIK